MVKSYRNRFFNIPNAFIFTGLVFLFISVGPLAKDELWYLLKELKDQSYTLQDGQESNGVEDSIFARFLTSKPVLLDPVNKDFSIVIEKIGVNAPIVSNVSISNPKAYKEALKNGVAHAINSDMPSDTPSNVYLFSHSSLNFWELGKYATTFNLLRKLEIGDKIHIFYNHKTFVYKLVNKEVVRGWDVYPITRTVIGPVLTLQTCDPPGTTLNRLVLTADLVEVY